MIGAKPVTRHRLLSHSLEQELSNVPLAITKGAIPSWLAGVLIRNGPSKFEAGGQRVRHWFDGLAMLHAFSFAEGKVSYTNRFLRTDAYRKVYDENSIRYAGFACDPCRSLFGRLFASFFPSTAYPLQNTDVNIAKCFDQHIALTETPLPVQFDPRTLQTIGVFDYADNLPKDQSWESAHPHEDSNQDELINYIVEFGPFAHYVVYRIKRGSRTREVLAKIPVSRPSYMHTFSLTENYIVLAEYPFVVNPLAPLLSSKGFILNYRWEPERGTVFTVISRSTGKVVSSAKSEPFFSFHHINAFERDSEVVIDLIAYPDAKIVMDLGDYGQTTPEQVLPYSAICRYAVNLAHSSVDKRVLSEVSFELPRINSQYDGRPYRFAYGADLREVFGPREVSNLYKIEVDTGATSTWGEPGCYPGEPIFVPQPGSGGEDHGLILSVVLNDFTAKSFLLVLDAATFREVARAEVPHAIPMGLHGNYYQ